MCEQTNRGASDLRKRYWQEHGRPPDGEGPHPDRGGPAYIPWLEALVNKLEEELKQVYATTFTCPECGHVTESDDMIAKVAQLEAELRELSRMHSTEYGNLKIAKANAQVTKMAHENTQLEAENERLQLAEGAIRRIGELSILMSTHDWFYRHTRRVLDEHHEANKEALGGEK